MKSPANRSHQSPLDNFRIGLLTIIAGTALLLGESADARGGRFTATGAGYGYVANTYGYDPWYGYTSSTITTRSGSKKSSSLLPSRYISALPAGAAPVVVFGKTYYFANGNYYLPEFYGGSTVYVKANP